MMRRYMAALTLLLAAAGCEEMASPVVPDAPASFAAVSRTTPPTGMGMGTLIDSIGPRAKYRIEYRNGPVMASTSNVYLIWYGGWDYYDPAAKTVMLDFVTSIGGSRYFSAVTHYRNAAAQAPSGGLVYGSAVDDLYSHGSSLTRAKVDTIVRQQLDAGELPLDTRGIYVVLASPDIAVDAMPVRTCAYRQVLQHQGSMLKYIYIGSPARWPALCAPQYIGPNGTLGADAMASLLAAELANTVTDPNLTAWYDRLGYEMADKCAWNFGATYTAANGARANVRLGQRDYLLQQLWVPTKSGGNCTLTGG